MALQLFRPFLDHTRSAQFLDDRRLNKQVLEGYQIARVCLAELGCLTSNTRYMTHPMVRHVYHGGKPYLPDLIAYIEACDHEFRRRGGKRGNAFAAKLSQLAEQVQMHHALMDAHALPPYFVFGDRRESDPEKVFRLYRQLLYTKWASDGQWARARIHL